MAADTKNTTANNMLDNLATLFPAGAVLEIRSGTSPGAEASATGTLLATITLPATPWSAASSGSKAKNGTWSDASADATGTAGYYRLRNAGDTERIDGTVAVSGADLNLDSVAITATQTVTISTFSYAMA